MPGKTELPAQLEGQLIILDTDGQFVYIGRLVKADSQFFELEEADVHDGSESPTSKEIYLMDARKFGIKKNRKRVWVRSGQVVSLSKLDDVIEY